MNRTPSGSIVIAAILGAIVVIMAFELADTKQQLTATQAELSSLQAEWQNLARRQAEELAGKVGGAAEDGWSRAGEAAKDAWNGIGRGLTSMFEAIGSVGSEDPPTAPDTALHEQG
ncbi:hypothetical protein [Candidatus Poriferisocius sp.]|uniref:hypothetical protein n=1 Tax=Candidatus Poriferisocius sp. TaxID=3101276 RepID=UPI003B51B372